MKILISGICGFVGSALAKELKAKADDNSLQIIGIDNLSRAGSETNRALLQQIGVQFMHGDIRCHSDLEIVANIDWVIDAAANPTVLAGVDGKTSSRQLLEHNLLGTINLLELCKAKRAGLILLSTSRVYSVRALAEIRLECKNDAFCPAANASQPVGFSEYGISEEFPTTAPVSLYGATKLASEQLALEYSSLYDFPVYINRCGVLGGAGQFGRADQGIFSFWIHSWHSRRPLRYFGFGGRGTQVRDCLHPRDLIPLLKKQLQGSLHVQERIINISGGITNSMSLAQLSAWCADRFGKRDVESDAKPRPLDAPWIVLDSSRAKELWEWHAETPLSSILEEIALHAERYPQWLDITDFGC